MKCYFNYKRFMYSLTSHVQDVRVVNHLPFISQRIKESESLSRNGLTFKRISPKLTEIFHFTIWLIVFK